MTKLSSQHKTWINNEVSKLAKKAESALGDCQNRDGTYNGAQLLASVSGLSVEEIKWTWNRMKDLRQSGKSGDEAKAIIAEEVKSRPWEIRQ